MSTTAESSEYKLDGLKWLLVVVIVVASAVGNSYLSESLNLLVRVLALIAVGVVAAFIALQTAKGSAFWALLKSARVEMRKVVWPTKPETNQTTMMVLVVVFVMALLLWGLDALIGKIASLFIG
ncbi:MAG: preprotein translocase subunit SecE [Marinagarivorans sp.]|nr:preprotein translocase subunit SecE [Marinagarivorans sp.]